MLYGGRLGDAGKAPLLGYMRGSSSPESPIKGTWRAQGGFLWPLRDGNPQFTQLYPRKVYSPEKNRDGESGEGQEGKRCEKQNTGMQEIRNRKEVVEKARERRKKKRDFQARRKEKREEPV